MDRALPEFDRLDSLGPLFDASQLPMWVYDPDSLEIVCANAAAAAMYGWSPEELVGKSLVELRPPEDVAALEAYRRDPDVRSRASFSAGSWRHRRRDGAIVHVEVLVDHIRVGGREMRLSTIRDETARMDAELERDRAVRAMFELAELERNRLATRLHDGVVQQLTAASLCLGTLRHDDERAAGTAAAGIGSTAGVRSAAGMRSAGVRTAEVEDLVVSALRRAQQEMEQLRAPSEVGRTLEESIGSLLRQGERDAVVKLDGTEPTAWVSAVLYRLVQLVVDRAHRAGVAEPPRITVDCDPREIRFEVTPCAPALVDELRAWVLSLRGSIRTGEREGRSTSVVSIPQDGGVSV